MRVENQMKSKFCRRKNCKNINSGCKGFCSTHAKKLKHRYCIKRGCLHLRVNCVSNASTAFGLATATPNSQQYKKYSRMYCRLHYEQRTKLSHRTMQKKKKKEPLSSQKYPDKKTKENSNAGFKFKLWYLFLHV